MSIAAVAKSLSRCPSSRRAEGRKKRSTRKVAALPSPSVSPLLIDRPAAASPSVPETQRRSPGRAPPPRQVSSLGRRAQYGDGDRECTLRGIAADQR